MMMRLIKIVEAIVVSIQSRKGHFYTLNVKFETPFLLNKKDKFESPNLRILSKGEMKFGKPIAIYKGTHADHVIYDEIKL